MLSQPTTTTRQLATSLRQLFKGGEIGGAGGLEPPPTLETGGAEPPHITICLYYNSNSKCLYVSAK